MATEISTRYASPKSNGRIPPVRARRAPQARTATQAHSATQAPKLSLFSDRQIGVSAFLGTPLAGALMFAYNSYKLGRSSVAMAIVVGTIGLTVVLALVGQLLPSPISQLLLLGVALGMKQLTATTFAEELKLRRETGRGWQSNWTALGIAVGAAIVVGSALVACFVALG